MNESLNLNISKQHQIKIKRLLSINTKILGCISENEGQLID